MGSSDECNTKSIDASVGGLVWVRRRNGSWWPGRIVGLDELSDSCLVSPKSGTPVKLLGRDDASVDWYNLEKSKRIKAFRCGEYDECIEKASAANSSKKAVKYARREDAILHALEIESDVLSKNHPAFCSRSERESERGGDLGVWPRESPSLSNSSKENEDIAEEVSTLGDTSNSTQELSQSSLSFEVPNQISPKVQCKRRRTPNDSEDDGIEGIKRMRGLEDLGMGIVTERKPQAGGDLDMVQQDTNSPCDLSTNSLSVGTHLNGSKGDISLKRKSSQVAKVYELFKRRNRRRPLTKVLENTAMVSVPIMYDELTSPYRSSLLGFSENMETSQFKSSPVIVDNSSESTGISCENGVPLNATEVVCDASNVNFKIKENGISNALKLPENDISDTLFDVPFIEEEQHSAGLPLLYTSCSSGKPQGGDVRRQSSQSSRAETVSLKTEGLVESGSTSSAVPHFDNTSSNIDKNTSKWKSKGKRKSRHSRSRKRNLRKFVDKADVEHRNKLSLGSVCRKHHISGLTDGLKLLPDCSLSPRKSLTYYQSRYAVHPKYQSLDFPIQNCFADSLLHDVDLKVEASYRPLHVPLVSVLSKLNGKAIVGHPLPIEVLADGLHDMGMPDLLEAEAGFAAKPNADKRSALTKNALTQALCSWRKRPKSRKRGFVSKKTRRLSALNGSQTRSEDEREVAVEKPRSDPVKACIPLKVVFCRLNEAVNGMAQVANGC